jgi:hypothetical protein
LFDAARVDPKESQTIFQSLIPAEANLAKPSFTFAPVLHDIFEGDFVVIGSPCV